MLSTTDNDLGWALNHLDPGERPPAWGGDPNEADHVEAWGRWYDAFHIVKDYVETADHDVVGRKRLARALGIDPDQDVITVWNLIERRVSEALAAKEWADQVLQKTERPDNPPKPEDPKDWPRA